jgi:hypothetical protein
MNFYVRHKDTKEKYLYLAHASESGTVFFLADLKTKAIMKVTEQSLRHDFYFDGFPDAD